MMVCNRSSFMLTWAVIYTLAVLFAKHTDALDCDRYCKSHRVSIGNCRCRPELFVKKSMPSSDVSDLNHDFILRELLREYFTENDEEDKK